MTSSHETYNITTGRSISSPVALCISVARNAVPVLTVEQVEFYRLSRDFRPSSDQGKYVHRLPSNHSPGRTPLSDPVQFPPKVSQAYSSFKSSVCMCLGVDCRGVSGGIKVGLHLRVKLTRVSTSLERRSLTCNRLRKPTVEGYGNLAERRLEGSSIGSVE